VLKKGENEKNLRNKAFKSTMQRKETKNQGNTRSPIWSPKNVVGNLPMKTG